MLIKHAFNYQSDLSQLVDSLKKQDAQLEESQRQGRYRLWDRPLNPELQTAYKQNRVNQTAYVYQTK